MKRMDAAWHRTQVVLAARKRPLLIALGLGLFLPAVLQAIVNAFVPASGLRVALSVVLAVAVLLAALWAQLTALALALEPAGDVTRASRVAVRRMPAALLVMLALLCAGVILLAPVWLVLFATGFDFAAAAASDGAGAMPAMSPAAGTTIGLYGLVLCIVMLVAATRLFVLMPVLLAEDRRLGAFRRSWRLTRHRPGGIFGVLLLYLLILAVSALAAKWVVGTAAALAFDSEGGLVPFIAAVAVAAVMALLSAVAIVFTAQFYALVVAREGAAGPVAAA